MHLTEGRGTGFPTIYKAMEDNNSPDPIFDTDGQSTYFLATLPACTSSNDQVDDQDKMLVVSQIEDVVALCNSDGDQVSDQVSAVVNATIHSRVSDVLHLFLTAKKRTDLFEKLGITNHSSNRKRYLDPLLGYGWIEVLYPDRKTSPKQMYQTTASGRKLLKLLTSSDKSYA